MFLENIEATFTHRDDVMSAVFSPDGTLVLTASMDGIAKMWGLQLNEKASFGHKVYVL